MRIGEAAAKGRGSVGGKENRREKTRKRSAKHNERASFLSLQDD